MVESVSEHYFHSIFFFFWVFFLMANGVQFLKLSITTAFQTEQRLCLIQKQPLLLKPKSTGCPYHFIVIFRSDCFQGRYFLMPFFFIFFQSNNFAEKFCCRKMKSWSAP